MTLTNLLSALVFTASISAHANTQATLSSQEKFLGQNLVQSTAMLTKVIPANKCLPKWKALEAVRVRVLREPTKIDLVKLSYGNGVFDEIHVRETLDKGQSTEWIGLKSSMQCLERIDVAVADARMETAQTQDAAPLVQVWGLVDDQIK